MAKKTSTVFDHYTPFKTVSVVRMGTVSGPSVQVGSGKYVPTVHPVVVRKNGEDATVGMCNKCNLVHPGDCDSGVVIPVAPVVHGVRPRRAVDPAAIARARAAGELLRARQLDARKRMGKKLI